MLIAQVWFAECASRSTRIASWLSLPPAVGACLGSRDGALVRSAQLADKKTSSNAGMVRGFIAVPQCYHLVALHSPRSAQITRRLAAQLVVALASPSLAEADIAPPQRAACYDRKIGQACTFGGGHRGSCAVYRCNKYAEAFDCVMCEETRETDAGTLVVVEPESPFSPPLFDPAEVAGRPSADAGPLPVPGPVPPPTSSCGRCAAALSEQDGGAVALTLVGFAALCAARFRKRR